MVEEQGQDKSARGARLPQVPIDQALLIAGALHGLAAASTVQRIAGQMGVSPSGGKFRSNVGAAGYFGLIRRVGERRELTQLGERALGSDQEAMEARRVAVMKTGFRPIFLVFRGRDVNEGLVQARLQDDYGVPANASASIARALVESGQQTGLISGSKFDPGAIEEASREAAALDEGSTEHSAAAHVGRSSTQRPTSGRTVTKPMAAAPSTIHVAATSNRPSPALHIDLQIHIPATATAEQIDQIFSSMAKHLFPRE
jgi:hypothetical protein